MRTAVDIAKKGGLASVTTHAVAAACGLTRAAVHYHFGKSEVLRESVVKYAIEREILAVVAQVVALNGDAARGIPPALKRRAMLFCTVGAS